MIKISVVIITFNEEKNLDRCLRSIQDVAGEVIIADSFSTDKTVEIANRYNAKVIQQKFLGYGGQKNFATAAASHDWILSLDADEALTPDLRKEIKQIKNNTTFPAYEMPRLTGYCGQWIHHSGWYPDKQTRLYNRTRGKWVERKVHEYWATDNNEPIGLLKGDLLHYSFSSISEHLGKIEKYTELSAREAVSKKKKVSVFKMLFSPFWHFFNEYFIRLGFLDGYNGYVICKLSAYSAFLKCTKIRLYSRK
jgi:glycosyltransferase involved in cell wall biosynthesis